MMYESLSLVKQRSYNNSVVRLHDGTVAEIAVIYEDEGVVKFKYRSLVGGVETMIIARMSDIKCPVIQLYVDDRLLCSCDVHWWHPILLM